MSLTLLFLTAALAASAAVLEGRDNCVANNCLRAVRATASQSRGYSDCSTYLVTTVTPTVLTITSTTDTITIPTSTVTITSYSIIGSSPPHKDKRRPEPAPVALEPAATLAARDPAPTVPAYASACSAPGAYSSACSCLGLLPRTSTLTVPPSTTTTVVGYTTTASATVTATTTVGACSPTSNYGLIYGSGDVAPPPGTSSSGSSFPSTAQGCCAACFGTEGCILYEYTDGTCSLSSASGPVVTPGNALCPYGITGADLVLGASFGGGPSGDVLGLGPCSVACALGIVGGGTVCVGAYNGT
ncbi:Mucin-5B [Xylographa trunciseda]|nr:Mucin-5B [Xylographa trunciseda]